MGPARLPLADLAQASVVRWQVSWGPASVWGRGSPGGSHPPAGQPRPPWLRQGFRRAHRSFKAS